VGRLPDPEPGTAAILRPDLIGDFTLASRALGALGKSFPSTHGALLGHFSWIPIAEWFQRRGVIEGIEALTDEFAPLAQEGPVRPDAMVDAASRLPQSKGR
jgi:hypothetical protein